MNAPDKIVPTCPTCGRHAADMVDRLDCDGVRRLVCKPCAHHNAEPAAAIEVLIDCAGGWEHVNADARADMHLWDGAAYVLVDEHLRAASAPADDELAADDEDDEEMFASIMDRISKLGLAAHKPFVTHEVRSRWYERAVSRIVGMLPAKWRIA